MMMHARVAQVSISAGGVPKTAVAQARVTRLGLEGDRHRDTEHHGGPERAVCLYALEAIEALHQRSHELCFIANSVEFPVTVEPS